MVGNTSRVSHDAAVGFSVDPTLGLLRAGLFRRPHNQMTSGKIPGVIPGALLSRTAYISEVHFSSPISINNPS